MTTASPPPAPAAPVSAPPARDRAAEQRARNARRPERGPVLPDRVSWLAVGVFLVLAFGLAWLVALPLWLSGEGLRSPWFTPTAALMMFTPAVAALVVVLVVKRPPSIPRLLGLGPIRPWKRTVGLTLLAGLVFTLLPIAAVFLGHLFGWLRLDLQEFSYFAEYLDQLGVDLSGVPIGTALALQFAALPISVLGASLSAFGEELGWRGWLVPNLRPLGTWPALILSGAIWGLWHAPVILLGYNYGRPDLVGLLCMVGWTILPGILLGWLRLRTASVWPAVIAHGAINATASTALLLTAAGQLPIDLIWGTFLGWPGLILMGVLILALVVSGAWRLQPQPGLTLAESETP